MKGVADRWREQYPEGYQADHPRNRDEVFKKLKSLNSDTCTEKDISDIIGNASWTRLECTLCEGDSEVVLDITPLNEYHTVLVCDCCAEQMHKLFVPKDVP